VVNAGYTVDVVETVYPGVPVFPQQPRLSVWFDGGANLNGSTRAIRLSPTVLGSNNVANRTVGGAAPNLGGANVWVSMLVRLDPLYTVNGNINVYEDWQEFWTINIVNSSASNSDSMQDTPSLGIRNGRFFGRTLQTSTTVAYSGPEVSPGVWLGGGNNSASPGNGGAMPVAGRTYLLVGEFLWQPVDPLNPSGDGTFRGTRLWARETLAPNNDYPLTDLGIPCGPEDSINTTGTSRLFTAANPANSIRFRSTRTNSFAANLNDFVYVDNIIIGRSCEDVIPNDPDDPLRVDLVSFNASSTGPGAPVLLEWETAAEFDNAGFNIYRASNGAPGARINPFPISAQGSEIQGSVYSFLDNGALESGEVRGYFLEDVEFNGTATLHGPVFVGGSGSVESAVPEWGLYN
jgi:hypothetical protein